MIQDAIMSQGRRKQLDIGWAKLLIIDEHTHLN